MPFIESDQHIPLSKAIGVSIPEAEQAEPSFGKQLEAAYRLENTLGSYLAQDGNLPDSQVTNPDFNPMDYLSEEEKLDEKFLETAVLADNSEEIEATRRQFARERADRETLAQGGIAATMVAAVADPINLIPVGGTAYKTYRGGASILSAGVATSAVAAGSTAATEAMLLNSQLERTYGEAALNVGAAAFLGGIIGATPVALKAKLDGSGIDSQKAFDDISDVMDPESKLNEGFNPSAPLGDKSIGAAQVMDDPEVRGKVARAVTKFSGFDPLSRTITSDEKLTRLTSNRLAENALDTEGGQVRQSVESKVKAYDGMYYKAFEGYRTVYTDYKKNGGTLSKKDFREAVSSAIRNGSPDPDVQRAADIWNKELYEPIKQKSIEAGILPEDVDVTTAKNYLNRLWNREKVAANIDKFNKVVSDWIVNRQPDLDIQEARVLANEIAGRIMSTPDGRLPYDYKMGENLSKGGRASGLSGTFKKRSFDIEDDLVEEFLENDIEELGYRYLKSTTPYIEMVNEFGPPDANGKFMANEIKDIEQSYISKMEEAAKAGDEKLRKKLQKRKDADIRDIAAMRDRILGVYNIADSQNPWVRAGRVARDLNYMRLLGGVVASSFPDVARIISAEGIVNTFKFGLKPLAANLKGFKVASKEAKEWGVGLDSLMGGRAEILADVSDYSKGGTAFERGVRSAASQFSNVNLMNFWTGGIKQLHAVVLQNRIINEMSKGIYDPKLAQLGIDEGSYSAMKKQVKKYGRKIDGSWVANTKDWDDPDLVLQWKAAMRKESDRVIIVPGQERPLIMSTEIGKTLFQFKTFMLSATQRIMISNLQQQDKHYIQGVLSMLSLGMMTYVFKQWDADRPIDYSPANLVAEGIDRSGMLGIFGEINNTLEKISSNNLGLRPIMGVSAPASRYASRSVLESAMGPSFGLAGDVVKTANAISNGQDWTESDSRAIRRLIPGQNLSVLRQGLDTIEKEINESLGVK